MALNCGRFTFQIVVGFLILTALARALNAQSLTFTTFAGSPGGLGWVDGAGSQARFDNPFGVAADAKGNVYVADTFNHTIRKISPSGRVTTLAGLAGRRGVSDGVGAEAHFSQPRGVAVDPDGNVYVADTGTSTIRKITPAGVVSTVAGSWTGPGAITAGS